jgi:hypothetical protein
MQQIHRRRAIPGLSWIIGQKPAIDEAVLTTGAIKKQAFLQLGKGGLWGVASAAMAKVTQTLSKLTRLENVQAATITASSVQLPPELVRKAKKGLLGLIKDVLKQLREKDAGVIWQGTTTMAKDIKASSILTRLFPKDAAAIAENQLTTVAEGAASLANEMGQSFTEIAQMAGKIGRVGRYGTGALSAYSAWQSLSRCHEALKLFCGKTLKMLITRTA